MQEMCLAIYWKGKQERIFFKPSSSIGDYVAARVTALIPGSGIGGALVRNAVTEGILSIERRIKKESNSALLSITKNCSRHSVDAGMEKITDRVTKHIRSKGPKKLFILYGTSA